MSVGIAEGSLRRDLRVVYLEVEVKAFAQVDLLGEALVFAHVKGQCVVAVGVLALAEEHAVVEADELAAGHPLLTDKNKLINGDLNAAC